MAPVVAQALETNLILPSDTDLVPIAIRDNQDSYSATSTSNASYYHSTSTIPIPNSTSLTIVLISETATITLTAITLITSESTITTLTPTEAPLLLSTSTNINLSPGQIAGIVLGTITGFILFIIVFYLLVTRAKWGERMVGWRLEQREKKYRYKTKRPPKKHIKPTGGRARNAARSRRARDRKQMQPTRKVKAQRAQMPTTPALRWQESDERANRQKTERATSKRGGNQEYRTRSRYELP